jgi:hypothetical protein
MTPDVQPTVTRPTTVGRFVLRTLGYLPVTFFVWYFAAPVLLYPAVLIVRAIAKLALPDIVRSVEQARATLTFITALRPSGAAAGSVLTVMSTC